MRSLADNDEQCIVLTTRPLIFSVFKQRLESRQASSKVMRTLQRLRVLLQMCVDSSQYSLTILRALRDQGLLGKLDGS
jgi:proline utilization trans-activator